MEKGIPFFKIEKGSRIALYGCGNNGLACYEQLIKSGFCRLSIWVDRNYTDNLLDGEKIKSVSELETATYDYVLITVMNELIAKQIKNFLLNMGIQENKIITVHDKAKPVAVENFNNKELILQYINDSFRKKCKLAKRSNEYYPEIEAALIGNIHDKDHVFNSLKALLNLIIDHKARFVLLVLMYKYGYFDKYCMEIFMKCMCSDEWIDDTYFDFVIDSTVMLFLHPDYIYEDFFVDRKMLQKKVCDYYKLGEIENNLLPIEKNIAIVTSIYLPDRSKEAVSVFVRKIAMEYVDLGYNVKIFVLRYNIGSELKHVFLMHTMALKSYTPTADKLTTAKKIQIGEQLNANLAERLQDIVKSIMDYRPCFILDMADERFPEAYALIRHFPIINLPMRVNSYSSEADLYISIDQNRVKKDNLVYHTMPTEYVRGVLLSYIDQKEEGVPYERERHGIQKEDFVMVTVGRNLLFEIDDEMITSVCQLLNTKDNIKWILVGSPIESANSLFNQLLLEKRIINWGFEKYLENLYRMCNIYLNPNRGGGGVSIRRAMMVGLPIAITDYPSDVLTCMPPECIVHGSYKELMRYVVQLCENQGLYQRVSKKTLDHINLITSKSDAEKVLEICNEAVRMRKINK